jgi:hypothetical protein
MCNFFLTGWTSFVQQQFYHLDIALKSNGNEPGSNGYSYSEMIDIWAAANATKSNVMMEWWTPNALYQTFLGSDAAFERVALPLPDLVCLQNRVNPQERCSNQQLERVGFEASCDEVAESVGQIVAKLSNDTNTSRFPLDVLEELTLSEFEMNEIFDTMQQRSSDKFQVDPRQGTPCLPAPNGNVRIR